jgi:hypothetical protein
VKAQHDNCRNTQALTKSRTIISEWIISLLQSGVRNGKELQIKSGMEVSKFSQTLTLMEISGTIRALGGNQWTLK